MKLSKLLNARETLLRHANLANLAFAHQTLGGFAERIERARLKGRVNLKTACPAEERYWPALTAIELSQSLIEEHFTEEDLVDFADAIAYATGREHFDLTFHIENFSEHFLAPLRNALEQSGIEVDASHEVVEEPNAEGHQRAA
jgi:hypothetical protein